MSNKPDKTPYNVHIGFGFHVNCYHSYRGDTPDALGFGSDIRFIRHIISVLDEWNERNIPVKGTWDFENAYSLEDILPRYAPDIIENVRRRQMINGDENILMGYNNGAMSAMTEREFLASIQLAVTNDNKSGLQDVFGSFAPVIRPQEVMFTPSQAALYQKAGVEAVCLYYSCVPFDAFRTLIPQLTDGDAFNPLRYCYNGGEVTILPTYSQSDVMDAGSLRWLVTDLHLQQQSGAIQRDVFLFINIDADSFLWEPIGLPGALGKIPNADGLNGLIDEIADLTFIRFDTPGNYLKNHPPVCDVFFGQDVADGNFSGYSSWAEKPFNRQIWTRLERARAYERVNGENDAEFEKRIRLLSTTHFGLASPVLNVVREQTALKLSSQMLSEAARGDESEDLLTLKSDKAQTLFCAQLNVKQGFCRDIEKLNVVGENLKSFTAVSMGEYEDGSVSIVYICCVLNQPARQISMRFDNNGSRQGVESDIDELVVAADKKSGMPVLMHNGKAAAACSSFITYRNRRVEFGSPQICELPMAGAGKGLRFRGEIHLKGEKAPGWYVYDFFKAAGVNSLFMRTQIQYPYTPEKHKISTQASNLGRFTDNNWTEVCPLGISLELNDDAVITKRNFMDDCSQFPLSDFWKAFPENENIDSFNHQLTGGILAVGDGVSGIAVAHSRSVLGSMAHCPMRLRTIGGKRILTLNPFGTYFGEQRYYPTRGNGCVIDLYNATMPQAQSLAPAYNGVCEQSVQALRWMPGELTDIEELASIADGVVAVGGNGITTFAEDNVSFPKIRTANASVKALPMTSASVRKLVPLIRGGVRLLRSIHRAKKYCRKSDIS